MNISLTVEVQTVDMHRLKDAIIRMLAQRSEGPWQVWLTPHEADNLLWRLRLSCPGYVTAVSLRPEEQSVEGVTRRLQELLASPLGCLDPAVVAAG